MLSLYIFSFHLYSPPLIVSHRVCAINLWNDRLLRGLEEHRQGRALGLEETTAARAAVSHNAHLRAMCNVWLLIPMQTLEAEMTAQTIESMPPTHMRSLERASDSRIPWPLWALGQEASGWSSLCLCASQLQTSLHCWGEGRTPTHPTLGIPARRFQRNFTFSAFTFLNFFF